jgi:hypothetical protein
MWLLLGLVLNNMPCITVLFAQCDIAITVTLIIQLGEVILKAITTQANISVLATINYVPPFAML